MSVVIDNSLTIPLSSRQLQSFSTWAKRKYRNYPEYTTSLKTSVDVDDYIWENMATSDMQAAWIESVDYLRKRSNDANVKRCQLNRKRINAKLRYMQTKLGRFAFSDETLQQRQFERMQLQERLEARIHHPELAETPEENRQELIDDNSHLPIELLQEYFGLSNEEIEREQVRRRASARELEQRNGMFLYIWDILLGIDTHGATNRFTLERFFRRNEERVITEMLARPHSDDLYDREQTLRSVIHMLMDEQTQPPPPRREKVVYTTVEISKEEALLPMKDDCPICMEKHTQNSVVHAPCGHQFGKVCFEQWTKMCPYIVSCPLCRAHCTTLREPTVPPYPLPCREPMVPPHPPPL
jgi:hypothetical protein